MNTEKQRQPTKAPNDPSPGNLPDKLKRALERDFQRHERREDSHQSFWRWLGVLGMVGWPIAVTTVGGALLGHYLDVRFNSGIQFTLLIVMLGAVLGSVVAWRVLGADR